MIRQLLHDAICELNKPYPTLKGTMYLIIFTMLVIMALFGIIELGEWII